MAITATKLIEIIDQTAAAADKMELTSKQRINAASKIDGAIPAFGPAWGQYATASIVHLERDGKMVDGTEYTMDDAQFRAYLAAKREFAKLGFGPR